MRPLRQFHTPLRSTMILACLAWALFVGCDQNPSSSPPTPANQPRDGFGQRLGTDVTAQPGRAGAHPPADTPRIVAFGDSLTAGLGVAQDEAYPNQLEHRLAREGYRYRVINAGVSGETTAGGLRRLSWILQNHPQIVILELGANDGLRGLKLEDTRANLEQIIRQLEQAQVTVVLAGMKMPPNYGADYTGKFEAIYPDLAKRYRLPLIPFLLEGVATSASLNQADGIHPTAEGHQVIAGNVMRTISPLLRKSRGQDG